MSRLCLRDLSSKGQVFLTRQGISLGPYSTMSLSGRREHVVPACRHAVGTISSSGTPDVRRMVSEGSRLSRSLTFPADHLHWSDCHHAQEPWYRQILSGFPAYSRMLTVMSPPRGPANLP